MNYVALRSFTILALLLSAVISRAESADPGPDIFPDTPENRALVAQAYEQYLAIDENHGHFIEVNGIRMHYLEWGDSSGTPLIWSHGYSSTGFELASVGQQLADAGYHVYSITYRGHGQTQVEDYNFSLSHIADDIVAMMDQLGIAKAVVGGLSLGGGVTTSFYENYPERALALVLEDGGADAVQARTETLYVEMKELLADMSDQELPRFDDRFTGFRYLASFYLPGWGGTLPEDVAPIFHSWVVPAGGGLFKAHFNDAKLMGEGEATYDPAQSHKLPLLAQSWRRIYPLITYRNLSVPMLIIDPTGDEFSPSADYQKLHAMHPDLINLVEYPDTPHAAHPMRPEWFVRDMAELRRRVN
jgi:pimeloyl-ACP methyl ester carboxylesterase